MITATTETVEVLIISPEGMKLAHTHPSAARAIMRVQIGEYGDLERIYHLEARAYRLADLLSPYRYDRHVTDDPDAWLSKIMSWLNDSTCTLVKITLYVGSRTPYEWGLLPTRRS